MSAIILSRNSLIEVILRSGSRDTCPAFEDIPSITSSREACSNYGEAVQSNVFYVIPTRHPADASISGGKRVFGVTLSGALKAESLRFPRNMSRVRKTH